jgi:arylsulfatase A-like enzyme
VIVREEFSGERRRVSAPLAALLGWLLVAAATALRLKVADPSMSAASTAHLAVAIGNLAVCGVLSAFVAASARLVPSVWGRRFGVAALGAGMGSMTLPEDLANLAGRLEGALSPTTLYMGSALALGAALALTVEIGRVLRRPRWRPLALGATVTLAVLEPFTLPGQYPALHFFAVTAMATLAGSALVNAVEPVPRALRAVALSAATLGLLSMLFPVSHEVHYRVVRDGDVVGPILGLRRPPQTVRASVASTGPVDEWLQPRAGLPDRPPTPGPRFASSPLVILLTVDCLRYELASGRRSGARLPNLRRLGTEGLSFDHAIAPSTSTVYTLSAVFSGKHYSLLEWSGEQRARIFPRDDSTQRFPDLLQRAGVYTAHAASFRWLQNDFGIVRGFERVDYETIPGDRWRPGDALTDALLARLEEVGERPGLLFAHYNDPHKPYKRGRKRAPAFQRYVAELEFIDEQIGRVLEAVERLGLEERTLVILSADHGEAFGEHGRKNHGNSLYQEALHVPLFIWGRNVTPGTLTAPVTLVDLGPTILDVFRLPIPAHFMGQSLYPAIHGQPLTLSRPIIAQLAHRRAIVTADLVKVIEDVRVGTREVYDLRRDPEELDNIVDRSDPRADAALDLLRTYFDVHRFRRPGYEEPFRAF